MKQTFLIAISNELHNGYYAVMVFDPNRIFQDGLTQAAFELFFEENKSCRINAIQAENIYTYIDKLGQLFDFRLKMLEEENRPSMWTNLWFYKTVIDPDMLMQALG